MYFDVVIVGGGLVGAGLAAALQDSGLQIALIDARSPTNDDPRLFALNYASCQFLKNIGIWPTLAKAASPIQQVHVSYQGRFGAVRLRHDDVNLPALGYVIPAHLIEKALQEKLSALSTFTLYQPAKLKTLHQHTDKAQLIITTQEGEKILHASLVIGADGAESTVRAQLGIKTTVFDYEQSAIVSRTMLSRSHQAIAYERFNAQGAIAMLPLSGDQCATIWTADNQTIADLMQLSDESFLQCLQQTFGYRLGRLQGIHQRHVFPLKKLSAEKVVEQNVFLLGNAAHTLHPIAAQGFNLAIYELALLAEKMKEKAAAQQIFSINDLQQISEKVQKQQSISMGLSHRLAQTFSQHAVFLSFAVQIGMVGLDVMTPIKKMFIQKIMGTTGSVPRLLLDSNEYEEAIATGY